jgi:RHS repeat-associated protein
MVRFYTHAVSTNGLTVGAAGTSGDFVVTTGTGCFWSISSPAGWLSFSPLAGTGSGSIGYVVHANGGSAARSATITVGSLTMTVSQAGTGTSTPPPPEPGGNETPTALPAAPPGGTPLYYHMDAIGSVRLITDQAGATVQRHDFMPFGGEVNMPPDTAKNPLRFAGKERDAETTSTAGALEPLSYFGARHYQNQTGRFSAPDPLLDIEGSIANPQRWNRYAYALNSPLRYIDPDGRYTCTGSEADCSAVRDYVDGIRLAAQGHAEGSIGRVTLERIVGFFGEYGARNGVEIRVGSLSRALAATSVDSRGNVDIVFDLAKTMAEFQGSRSELVGAFAHEGMHGIDGRARGGDPRSRGEALAGEYRAYWANAHVSYGLWSPSAYRFFSPVTGYSESAIQAQAERTTKTWCEGSLRCR